MTHSTARKRGHGSALLDFASKIADEWDYPLYLDSDKAAMPLYERKGYVAFQDAQRLSEMIPMVRPRRSERKDQETCDVTVNLDIGAGKL